MVKIVATGAIVGLLIVLMLDFGWFPFAIPLGDKK